MRETRVSVVGLGKLGACMAAAIASKGFEVVGIDVNPKNVELLNEGRAPILEPGLQSLISRYRSQLTATLDMQAAVHGSEITFFVVPTPSEEDGSFSIRFAVEAAQAAGKALATKMGYHLFVLTSTVLPGSSEHSVLPALEASSGKRAGTDFGFCYSPEFIALGSVIRDFLNPDFVLIGESDNRAGELLEKFMKAVCENDPPVKRMSFVNAELTKIAVNTFVTTKITFANMLAALCEELPGADVDVVTGALGHDSRIGRRYLRGGLGYGGPCFPRDNRALSFVARRAGQATILPDATDELNRGLASRLVDRVMRYVQPGTLVGILGLSYKPGSNVVEESQAIYLAGRLAGAGARVVAYDPVALENAKSVLGPRIEYATSVADVLGAADVVVAANPDPVFASIRATDFGARPGRVTVIDCWRFLADALSEAPEISYVPLGIGGGNHAEIA